MTPRKAKFGTLFLVGWLFAFAVSGTSAAPRGTVAVVVSPKNSASNLTLGELRKIFSGEKRIWPDGSRVKLFTRGPGTPERTALLRILGKS